MARLILARRARADLLALDWLLIDAVEEALSLLRRDPCAGYPLRGRLRGLNSLRVGSYRIIYQLADGNKIVRVAAIRHRSTSLHREELEADWERAKDGGTPEPIEPLP